MFERLIETHPGVVALAALYGLSFIVSLPGAFRRGRGLAWTGFVILVAAFLANTTVIVARWVEAGRPPFKTLFETMLFYPWCVAAVTIVLVWLHRLLFLVPCAAAISVVGLAYALLRPDVEMVNLPPALQSGWFVPHVVTYFVSYGALFVSFVLAAAALMAPREGRWSSEALTDFGHNTAVFGVATLTLGLVMGAAWGKFAWGDYWSWDPKENWALVTWLAYVAYLHFRKMPGWEGRRSMWLLVISFGAVVFTYLGMNILPAAEKSLHVYQ